MPYESEMLVVKAAAKPKQQHSKTKHTARTKGISNPNKTASTIISWINQDNDTIATITKIIGLR